MHDHDSPRTAFVFAGGGSLGAVHVGMVQALVEHGCSADLVVGASIGAINGAYFASHPGPEGVAGLRRLWGEFRREKHMPLLGLQGWLAFRLERNHVLDPAPLRRFVLAQLRGDRIEDARIPCHIVATSLTQAQEVVLSSGPWGDAIMASCAIPAVYPPVAIDGRPLVDGGMCNNTPISVAIGLGAERVIVLPTGSACAAIEAPRTLVGMALQGVSMMINRRLLDDCERYQGRGIVRIVPPVCPLDVTPFDFTKSARLIEAGYASARAWLTSGGLDTDLVPDQVRPHHHDADGALVAH